MKRQRGFISHSDFVFFMVVLVVIGILIGGALFLGVPWLWGILRPFVHGWTA